MSISPGTRLGAYEIVGPLGAGGMGEVYRARDTRLGRGTLPLEETMAIARQVADPLEAAHEKGIVSIAATGIGVVLGIAA